MFSSDQGTRSCYPWKSVKSVLFSVCRIMLLRVVLDAYTGKYAFIAGSCASLRACATRSCTSVIDIPRRSVNGYTTRELSNSKVFSRLAVPISLSRGSIRLSVSRALHWKKRGSALSGHPHRGNCNIRDSTLMNPAFRIKVSSRIPILPSFCGCRLCRYRRDLQTVSLQTFHRSTPWHSIAFHHTL